MNPEEMVPDGAFTAVPRLRHVSIEAGIRVVGAEAWQCCQQLRIVKMPASVHIPRLPAAQQCYSAWLCRVWL